jgi:hypothetical protein
MPVTDIQMSLKGESVGWNIIQFQCNFAKLILKNEFQIYSSNYGKEIRAGIAQSI